MTSASRPSREVASERPDGRSARPSGIVDGRPAPPEEMVLPVLDRSVRYGLGVFETVAVHTGRPFLLGQHALRMVEGLGRLGLRASLDPRTLVRWGLRAVALEGVREGALRIVATAGDGGGSKPRVLAWAQEEPLPGAGRGERGLRATIHPLRRDPQSPLSGIKALAYAGSYLAREEARARGFDEALLRSPSGGLAEGAASSLFLVEARGAGWLLVTPPLSEGILPGVTRAFVLQIAPGLSLMVREEPIAPERLASCREAFLTSALLGIASLVELDGQRIGDGAPGPVTRALRRSYATTALALSAGSPGTA